jgi:hypothetical protein
VNRRRYQQGQQGDPGDPQRTSAPAGQRIEGALLGRKRAPGQRAHARAGRRPSLPAPLQEGEAGLMVLSLSADQPQAHGL